MLHFFFNNRSIGRSVYRTLFLEKGPIDRFKIGLSDPRSKGPFLIIGLLDPRSIGPFPLKKGPIDRFKIGLSDPRSKGPFSKIGLSDPRSKGHFSKIGLSDPRSKGPFSKIGLSDPRSKPWTLFKNRSIGTSVYRDSPIHTVMVMIPKATLFMVIIVRVPASTLFRAGVMLRETFPPHPPPPPKQTHWHHPCFNNP